MVICDFYWCFKDTLGNSVVFTKRFGLPFFPQPEHRLTLIVAADFRQNEFIVKSSRFDAPCNCAVVTGSSGVNGNMTAFWNFVLGTLKSERWATHHIDGDARFRAFVEKNGPPHIVIDEMAVG